MHIVALASCTSCTLRCPFKVLQVAWELLQADHLSLYIRNWQALATRFTTNADGYIPMARLLVKAAGMIGAALAQ